MKRQYKRYASIMITMLSVILLMKVTYVDANNNGDWSYDNYLNSFQVLAYDDPIIPGQACEITMEIESNTDVEIHVELKGIFTWGDWTFSKVVQSIQEGAITITQSLEVPEEFISEEITGCYYYVYVTLPQDSWNSQVWGLTQKVDIFNDPDFIVNEFPYGSVMSLIAAFLALIVIFRSRA